MSIVVNIQEEYNKWFELTKQFYIIETKIKNFAPISTNQEGWIQADVANQIISKQLEKDRLVEELETCKLNLELQNSLFSELLGKLGNTKVLVFNDDSQSNWLVWCDKGKVRHEKE